MGCLKLHIGSEPKLSLAYLKKGQKPQKKTLDYYPFGLKQKGYNNTSTGNGNDLAQAFKYNGVELNESLGLNLYEMFFRSYDPAIGRFNGIDPVVHFSMGTSVAFDNNPIYWADPSGADSYYGGRNGSLSPEDNSHSGDDVYFGNAIASVIGADSDSSSLAEPPTKFVTDGGVTIADTDDGSDEVFVIRRENVGKYTEDLKKSIETKEDLNSDKNEKLGNKYGYNLNDIADNIDNSLIKDLGQLVNMVICLAMMILV